MRWHVPAPSGSENGTARPGRSSPAWQGGCCNSDPPLVPPFLSCLPSLLFTTGVMLCRWGPAGPAATAPRFQVAPGTGPVPAGYLPTEWVLQLYWTDMTVPHRNRKLQQTAVGSCLWLPPPAPTQHQKLEAEGLLLWLSWSQRQMLAAVWWLSLTCSYQLEPLITLCCFIL